MNPSVLGVDVAIARDLWGHVQRQLMETPPNVRLVSVPQPTVHVGEGDSGWHLDKLRNRAAELFDAWVDAVDAGKTRKADRLRQAWVHTAHLDRLAYARETARERGLRLDPMGRGPLVDVPTVHYRDRLPWALTPLGHYDFDKLPTRAASVVETWNGSGWVFDRLYLADEPVCSGHFPVHSLIGAVSPDGRSAEWFTLDRWAS
ncbi:MAG TPA: hypothetical protein VFA34_13725 [Actinomycetota bacterium]|nr:hypothetical protein [Actinomycetota bacterium]